TSPSAITPAVYCGNARMPTTTADDAPNNNRLNLPPRVRQLLCPRSACTAAIASNTPAPASSHVWASDNIAASDTSPAAPTNPIGRQQASAPSAITADATGVHRSAFAIGPPEIVPYFLPHTASIA